MQEGESRDWAPTILAAVLAWLITCSYPLWMVALLGKSLAVRRFFTEGGAFSWVLLLSAILCSLLLVGVAVLVHRWERLPTILFGAFPAGALGLGILGFQLGMMKVRGAIDHPGIPLRSRFLIHFEGAAEAFTLLIQGLLLAGVLAAALAVIQGTRPWVWPREGAPRTALGAAVAGLLALALGMAPSLWAPGATPLGVSGGAVMAFLGVGAVASAGARLALGLEAGRRARVSADLLGAAGWGALATGCLALANLAQRDREGFAMIGSHRGSLAELTRLLPGLEGQRAGAIWQLLLVAAPLLAALTAGLLSRSDGGGWRGLSRLTVALLLSGWGGGSAPSAGSWHPRDRSCLGEGGHPVRSQVLGACHSRRWGLGDSREQSSGRIPR